MIRVPGEAGKGGTRVTWRNKLESGRQRIATALGRSPSLPVTIARLCVAIACFLECRALHPGGLAALETECLFFVAYLAWAIGCPAIAALSWKTNIHAWPVILVGDVLICGFMILYFEPYVLPVLLFAILVLAAIQARFSGTLALLTGITLGLVFILRGEAGTPIFPAPQPHMPLPSFSAATVILAGFVALSLTSARAYRNTIRSWGEELLMVGSNFRSLPVDFLLQRLSDLFRAERVGFFWSESDDEPVNLAVYDQSTTNGVTHVGRTIGRLVHIEAVEGAFLFDHDSSALLSRDAIGHPLVAEAPGVTAQIVEAFTAGRGRSFPVRAGELVGRIYVIGPCPMSESALIETERAAELTEGVFERYFFLNAWRNRAFVDARHALSRDLHDSVLQTLAALRLQIASLIDAGATVTTEERRDKLALLQAVIVEEQARLRDILDESYRASEQKVELVDQLTACTTYLSRQWGVECRLLTQSSSLPVDSNTAVEVEFLAREAVANAVQHADARKLTLVVAIDEDTLFLSLRNENRRRGRAPDTTRIASRSLSRRLTSLGGIAYSEEVNSGSLLAIRIPLRRG